MRTFACLLVVLAATACWAGPLGLSGTDVTSPDGVAYTKYRGLVPSFDGVPLDVHLTVPQGTTIARPLIVMMHGWGGSKSDWESTSISDPSPDKSHYDKVAFVGPGDRPLTAGVVHHTPGIRR